MRRFFVEHIPGESAIITLTGKEANHLRNVLRMKQGDPLILMDGKGLLFEARVEKLHHKGVRVHIIRSLPAPDPSPIEIHLAQALIKSRPMDLLIQKATELGAASITPFSSERTAVRTSDEILSRKMVHWEKIMKTACKQSGRPFLPALKPPLSFEKIMEGVPHQKTLNVLLWEGEHGTDLKGLLRSMEPQPHIEVIIGPEGGFTSREIHIARGAGFRIVSLGSGILRSETAALTLVSIIQYEWGDLSVRQGV